MYTVRQVTACLLVEKLPGGEVTGNHLHSNQARIQTSFHRFMEIGQSFQNDSETQARGLKRLTANPEHFLGKHGLRPL